MQFRHHVETLLRTGTAIDLLTLIAAFEGSGAPSAFMITFDDGYRGCRDVALPILRELGVPATFFISTAFPGQGRLFWWEQVAFILRRANRLRGELVYPYPITVDMRCPQMQRVLDDVINNTLDLDVERFLGELRDELAVPWSRALEAELASSLIMDWDDVRALADAGMDIASHTRRHPVLETINDAQLRDELVGSRADLEAQLGKPVRAIAYPVGRPPSARVRVRRSTSANPAPRHAPVKPLREPGAARA